MPDAIALTPETFDRFDRAASRVLGLDNGGLGAGLPNDAGTFHLLRVTSSTMGTYGYPAKIQQFDPSDGSFADSVIAPATVYLVDPTDAVLRAGEKYDARFVGFRGAAGEAVYEVSVYGVRRFPIIDTVTEGVTGSAIWKAYKYYFTDAGTVTYSLNAVTPEYGSGFVDPKIPLLAHQLFIGEPNGASKGLVRLTASDIHFAIYHLDDTGDFPREVLYWDVSGVGKMSTPGKFNAYEGYLTQSGGFDVTGGTNVTGGMTFANGLYISGDASLDDLLPIDLGTDVTGYLNAALLTGTVDGGTW